MKKILQKNRTSDLYRKKSEKRWHIQKKTAKKNCRIWLMERPNCMMSSQNYRIISEAPLRAAILTNPAVIIGLHFEHMWFVNNQNVLYQGHVLSVKCSKRSNMPKVMLLTGNTMKIRMKEITYNDHLRVLS